MRYLGVSIAAGVCLIAAGAVSADEIRLADNELDAVTAGLDLGFEPADFSLTSSPLLQQAAFLVLVELDGAFVEGTDGAVSGDIFGDPTFGPVAFGLFEFSGATPNGSGGFDLEPIKFPFGLTPPPS